MKISVDLAQPVCAALQPPPPGHAQMFNPSRARWREKRMRRVGIRDAHDALAVPHQFADAPDV